MLTLINTKCCFDFLSQMRSFWQLEGHEHYLSTRRDYFTYFSPIISITCYGYVNRDCERQRI